MNDSVKKKSLTYSIVEALYKKSLIDKKFCDLDHEFNNKIEILRYSEAELTEEKRDLTAQIETLRYSEAALTEERRDLAAQVEGLAREKDKFAQAFGEARAEVEALERAHYSKAVELDALMQRLSAIETSSIWRLTRAPRRLLAGLPGLRRFLRRSVKLVFWTMTFQLPRRYREYRAGLCATSAAPLEPQESGGCYNSGWYGGRRLEGDELFVPALVPPGVQAQIDECRARAADQIVAIYDPVVHSAALELLRQVAPIDLIRGRFSTVEPAPRPQLLERPSFSIITPFYAHIDFFEPCAASVDALVAASGADSTRIEWIVVNDDPLYAADDLLQRIPLRARPLTRILSDGQNQGIAARSNEACAFTKGDWLLFLDCDDQLEENAVRVLDHYIALFPDCRYISSGMIDIDEAGTVLRYRANSDPTQIFEAGMTVGHLKAIRRDLFNELGGFRLQHSGCQDYDLALRTSLNEPILCIPDYLYRYRWHKSSQSVGRKVRQATNTIHVLREFLRLFADQYGGPSLAEGRSDGADRPEVKFGLCLIRTQGSRLELLAEAVASVVRQGVKMMACVVVHGTTEVRDEVADWLASRGLDAEVVQAPVLAKKRGYPLNVGLAYLRTNPGRYDFVCLLDDDDILYPFFSMRLAETMNLTDCDVAVCVAASRVPWEEVRPGHTLKPVAALAGGNFITNHSYIVRASFLLENEIWFDETLHYLEDWDFLVSLFKGDARFEYLPEVLCEYRIIGDGNREQKANPTHYEYCVQAVMKNARAAAGKFGFGRYIRDLAAFDFEEQAEYAPWEIGHLLDARGVFLCGQGELES